MTKVPHRILLVEDTQGLRESMKMILERAGHVVDAVGDAEAAMEAFQRHRPDLILLDILLPRKSGLELLQDLRKLPKGKSLNVIVVSQLGESEYRQRAKALGVKDYFVKANYSLQEILGSVNRVLCTCEPVKKPAAKKTVKKTAST